MKKRSIAIMIAALVVIVGLAVTYAIVRSRSAWPSVTAEIPSAPERGSGALSIEATSSNRTWYAERLESLGFYVFPAPEALPPFTVQSLDGKEMGVTSLAGKVVLLNFWATWCPPCRSEMPSIQILHEQLKGKAFEVMAISVAEKPSTVKEFLKTNHYTFPLYLDESGSASAPFSGRGIPTTFILDKSGRAIAAIVGARSYGEPEVVALFKELSERLP